MSTGETNDNYGSAEFVARSLAAGGFIPNLNPFGPQSEYLSYNYNNEVFNLLIYFDPENPANPGSLFATSFALTETPTN